MTTELARIKKQLANIQDHHQQQHDEVVELLKKLQGRFAHKDDGKKGKGGVKKRKLVIEEFEIGKERKLVVEEFEIEKKGEAAEEEEGKAAEEEEEETAAKPPATRARATAGDKGVPPPKAKPQRKTQVKEKGVDKPPKPTTFLDPSAVSEKISEEDKTVLKKASEEFKQLYNIEEKIREELEPNQANTQYLYMMYLPTWDRMQRLLTRHKRDYVQAPPPPPPKSLPLNNEG